MRSIADIRAHDAKCSFDVPDEFNKFIRPYKDVRQLLALVDELCEALDEARDDVAAAANAEVKSHRIASGKKQLEKIDVLLAKARA